MIIDLPEYELDKTLVINEYMKIENGILKFLSMSISKTYTSKNISKTCALHFCRRPFNSHS